MILKLLTYTFYKLHNSCCIRPCLQPWPDVRSLVTFCNTVQTPHHLPCTGVISITHRSFYFASYLRTVPKPWCFSEKDSTASAEFKELTVICRHRLTCPQFTAGAKQAVSGVCCVLPPHLASGSHTHRADQNCTFGDKFAIEQFIAVGERAVNESCCWLIFQGDLCLESVSKCTDLAHKYKNRRVCNRCSFCWFSYLISVPTF